MGNVHLIRSGDYSDNGAMLGNIGIFFSDLSLWQKLFSIASKTAKSDLPNLGLQICPAQSINQ